MLIYEVNLEVDEEVNYKMAGWLPEHIQKLLDCKGFKSAYWYFRVPEDEGGEPSEKTFWTIQYVVDSRADLDEYLNGPAGSIRAEAEEKFGGKFKASRRIMTLIGVAGPAFDQQTQGSEEAPT